MVVDDEPAIAEGISATLSALTGHDFHPYSNSLQALSVFKSQPYNLVLTDLTMPGIGGFELMTQIKKLCPGTDFIVITAHKSMDVVHHSHLLGAMNIFYKPLNIEELEQAVQNCHQKFLFWKNRFQEVTYVNQ
ncbi:MAG: response regulator [Pseudomonadota bacterium]